MVFDHHRQGLPIAWVITSWQRKLDLIHWLLTLKECTLKEDPAYSLSCFIKDDASQECHAIKYNIQFTYLSHSILCSFIFEGFILFFKFQYFHVVMDVVVFLNIKLNYHSFVNG